MNRIDGWAEQGDLIQTAGGVPVLPIAQGSFPLCTVTVYLQGTNTLATIYSDDASPPTLKANPFTADATGYYFFYGPNGRYDVRFSGIGITAPFTVGDRVAGFGDAGAIPILTANLPASSDISKGRIYYITDGSAPGLWLDTGPSAFGWIPISSNVPSSTVAGLPLAGTPGRLRNVTDQNRGLWMDDGTEWFSVSGGLYNVRNFGAVGDGSTDDTAAIQACFNAANAAGGGYVIFQASATYKCASALSLDGMQRIAIWGNGATLNFSASSGNLLTLKSVIWITIRDLHFTYTNASYTGILIQSGWSGLSTDPSYITFEHCYFHGTQGSAISANILICLDRAIFTTIRDCQFGFANFGILGLSATFANYSNVTTIDHCTFFSLNTTPIYGPGEAWTITNNAFEALANGKIGSLDQFLSFAPTGLVYAGNWHGDMSVAGGGQWVRLHGNGLQITGNFFGGSVASGSDAAIRLTGAQGVFVGGNTNSTGFTNFIDLSGNCFGVTLMGNNMGTAAIGGQSGVVQLFGRGNYNQSDIG